MLVLSRLHDFRDEVEKIFIEFMLDKYGRNVSKTAQALDIQRSHLYNKMEKYGIRKSADDE
ncbi:helix-turn-helix domain-containing protein [Chitinophaga lutea]